MGTGSRWSGTSIIIILCVWVLLAITKSRDNRFRTIGFFFNRIKYTIYDIVIKFIGITVNLNMEKCITYN